MGWQLGDLNRWRIFWVMPLVFTLNTAAVCAENASEQALRTTIQELENTLDARIGVLIREHQSDWQWGHREDERFLMASTFKSVLCGSVLDRVDSGLIALDDPVAIHAKDILAYAPITKDHVGSFLTVGDLCAATLDLSDNTAANLLIDRLGGTQEVTAYLYGIGDHVTHLDRKEPELNIFVPGDLRDTTSPRAMLFTWETMLLGDGLMPASRKQLAQWMSYGGVTRALIRSNTPADWTVIDKSGGGHKHTRNIVAMIAPPSKAPYFVAIYVSDTLADWSKRNNAVTEIGAAVVEVIKNR